MATFKAEIYAHQKRADGTYNIKIRVTHKQRKKYLATPWYVGKEDMTRALKLKNQRYIDMVEDLLRKYRSICNSVGEGLDDMSVEQVVELITRKETDKPFDLDIVDYTRKFVTKLDKAGRGGTARAYEVAINSLCRFVGRESVSIKEITVQFLTDWIAWIAAQPPRKNCKKGDRAQSLYLAQLRAMYNRAKKEFNDEEAGIIRIPFSPFNKVEIPKPSLSRKRALTVEQLHKFSEIPYTTILQPGVNRFNFAKDVFLLSFMLVGMNAVDLYTATDCKGGRITYQRAKTRNRRADNAEISIKLEPEVMALFEKYRDPSGQRVFKFYKLYSSMDTFCAALNKGLKKLGDIIGVDDLEFYAARHSWATIANNDAGVDKYTVHEALNHVDETMRVTDIYIRKNWERIDKANRAVLDLLQLNLPSVDEPKK
ncbi:tyrosine-type recombinase/integrase [Lepagella muris]|uniref:Transposase n=1 Tax=Lepagella muris TaxID=3032870 RepID=A0AC61RHG3_9BACT|nr:site-specific integrase [Lepagella muris]TGY80024.1 transposase [Lepagella muris]THG53262.1 transposase [Bacteroidales bacterium]TKC64852.1 transposase [Bacteroidales bacterium]